MRWASHRVVSIALAATLFAAACGRGDSAAPTAAGTATPGQSVWQFAGRWSRAGGGELALDSLRGAPAFLLFFYGSCDYACPALVHELQRVDAELPPAARERLRFVLVTIDPERDTLERLDEYAQRENLDRARWFLLRGSSDQIRELTSAVGVRYRPGGTGQFSHTMRILLLDRDGVELEHWDRLEPPLEPIVRAAAAAAERG